MDPQILDEYLLKLFPFHIILLPLSRTRIIKQLPIIFLYQCNNQK